MHAPAPAGLWLIIRYKFVKAAVELGISATFLLMGTAGSAVRLAHVAQTIRRHLTEAWAVALAEQLTDASTAKHVMVVAIALLADGIVTLIEAWALYRRYAWARWLVVLTTAALVPFEIRGLIRHPNAVHALLLLVNVLIVVYLVVRGEGTYMPAAKPAREA